MLVTVFPRSGQESRAEASDPVAVCASRAAADFVAVTLAAHGIDAHASWTHEVYPSLGWVEGYRVTVAAGAEAEARRVLAALSRDDVSPLPDGEDEPGRPG